MNNDLISREALKEELRKYFTNGVALYQILTIIDNAPTVEERPQGEWIYETKLDGIGWWHCSNCMEHKEWVGKNSNFCPNCGADMRGDT